MKFKELVTKLQEKNEEGKPETTKNFASATPGQPAVVFDTDIQYDGVKIAQELDPAGDMKHQQGHALSRKDTDNDGDVDSQDAHTPDEVTGAEKKDQTMHLLKKGAAERSHTKRLHKAYESAKQGVAEDIVNEDQKSEWERIQAMDKGSLLGGKEEVRKKLAYLNAVYAYRQKYKQDTLKVKKELERINQSRIAEAKKEVTKDDVIKLLVKYGNTPQSAKTMVDKEFASAVKRHPEATASKIAEIIRVVAEATDQGYWQVVYKDKNGKAGAEKNFDNEASAKKHAERGNAVDKVGGKYHVYHVKGRMDEQTAVAPVPGDKWKDQAVMVNTTHKHNGKPQRVVIDRKNIKNYPSSEGWKEVAPGQKVKEEVEQIAEAEDKTLSRLKQLVRFGLMDKSKLPLLTRAIGNLEKGQITNPTERAVLFELLNELIGVVTGDDAMFAKVRMSVQNEDFDVSEE